MPYVKPWYARVDWPLWLLSLGCLGLSLGLLFVFVVVVHAGGPTVVTWNQSADCGSVSGWELLQASVTTAQPNPPPSTAPVGVSIPNTGTPPCGLAMTRTVTLAGIGPFRFWLRGVSPAGTRSAVSNAVDTTLPFSAPDGLQVVTP